MKNFQRIFSNSTAENTVFPSQSDPIFDEEKLATRRPEMLRESSCSPSTEGNVSTSPGESRLAVV